MLFMFYERPTKGRRKMKLNYYMHVSMMWYPRYIYICNVTWLLDVLAILGHLNTVLPVRLSKNIKERPLSRRFLGPS